MVYIYLNTKYFKYIHNTQWYQQDEGGIQDISSSDQGNSSTNRLVHTSQKVWAHNSRYWWH